MSTSMYVCEDCNRLNAGGGCPKCHGDAGNLPGWYWLSFADGTGFLGACIVSAPSLCEALRWTHQQGINPGGEIRIAGPIPSGLIDKYIPEHCRYKLLSLDDVDQHCGGAARMP